MAYNNNREGFKLNEENIASFLKDAVNRVEKASNAEIETLKQIKKLFKKNVPFSRRSYVAALLIKNANSGFKSNRFSRTEKTEKFTLLKLILCFQELHFHPFCVNSLRSIFFRGIHIRLMLLLSCRSLPQREL